MVLFLLKMKADLENISELQPQFENLWKFNISSTDGEERLGITVSKADVLELNGSKGDANYVMKWHKADSHQAYIKLVDVKKVDGTYKTSGEWTTLIGLECRGLVPTAWIPGNRIHVIFQVICMWSTVIVAFKLLNLKSQNTDICFRLYTDEYFLSFKFYLDLHLLATFI